MPCFLSGKSSYLRLLASTDYSYFIPVSYFYWLYHFFINSYFSDRYVYPSDMPDVFKEFADNPAAPIMFFPTSVTTALSPELSSEGCRLARDQLCGMEGEVVSYLTKSGALERVKIAVENKECHIDSFAPLVPLKSAKIPPHLAPEVYV